MKLQLTEVFSCPAYCGLAYEALFLVSICSETAIGKKKISR